MNGKLLIMGALSLGVAGAVPSISFAEKDVDKGLQRDDVDGKIVEIDQVPRAVRQSIHREKGDDRISRIWRIEYEGRTSYRARFDGDKDTRIVRISEDGAVINERTARGGQDVKDSSTKLRFSELPDDVRRGIQRELGDREIDQITRIDRTQRTWYVVEPERGPIVRFDDRGRVLGPNDPVLLSDVGRWHRHPDREFERDFDDFARGDSLSYENLPGEVKQTVGHERGMNDRVTDVTRTRRDDKTIYFIRLEAADRARLFIVEDSGRLIATRNVTDEGHTRVDFDTLPGDVKSTIAKQGGDVRRVVQVTRNNRTWYVVTIAERGETKTFRIGRDGNIIDD